MTWIKVRVANFHAPINFGRGFQTKVIDLSQGKHRQTVSAMDYCAETGELVLALTSACGISGGRPAIYRVPSSNNAGVIESPPEPKPEPKAPVK